MQNQEHPTWKQLLIKAVNEPGTISTAYSAFWNYSAGNQQLALWQCLLRGIKPGPICTYPGWIKKHRYVRKGEKAITLCMPIVFRKTFKNEEGEDQEETRSGFVYKNHWFVLSQTEGEEFELEPIPEWSKERALAVLNITERQFDMVNGNVGGYASGQSVAINPLNDSNYHYEALFHELAHVLLHTGNKKESETTDRAIKEVEAEAVALIVCESLGVGNPSDVRGYIQHWLRNGGYNSIPESSARHIYTAADKIIKAGQEQRVQELVA